MRVGLQGGDETIDPRGYDAETGQPGFAFPHRLPQQPRAPDFSHSSECEQQHGLGNWA